MLYVTDVNRNHVPFAQIFIQNECNGLFEAFDM